MSSRLLGRHAIVIGGSLGGLCTARVLADHYERVTLVERDRYVDDAEPRRGVPQGRHLHGLLRRGEELLEGWFPGLAATLIAGGAVPLEFGSELRWFHAGAWKVDAPSGVTALALSRPFLELEVRRRVLALPNLDCRDDHDVIGLVASPERARVTGVTLRTRGGDRHERTLEADLVVDTTGRGSALPRWLEGLGRSRPEESHVRVNVGYASRVYERPPEGTVPWKGCYILGNVPESKRLGAIFPMEGGRWISVLAGVLGDHPQGDEEGFLAFARSLPRPDIWDALRNARPLADAAITTFPAHQRRHYERMRDFPDGLIALGDAHCSFNPIYGQGITTAALSAAELGRFLAGERGPGLAKGFSSRVQRALAGVVAGPWMMSTGEDFRHPEVGGERPPFSAAMQWYTARVHRAAHTDPVVARQFYRAMHMLDGPAALMSPLFAMRVLNASRRVPPALPDLVGAI